VLESNLYIACLNLASRQALVVGAGTVGLEKVEGLLACDARVRVVAPDAGAGIRRLAGAGSITWDERGYESSDLDGCLLVVAATSDTDLNRRVYEDAESRALLVNVVDVPELCNFILPAIVRQGPIAVAISTSGASPALAQRMRDEAAKLFGAPYADLAALLDEVRAWAKTTLPTYQDRKAFFDGIVNGDPDPIALLQAGDIEGARALIAAAQQRASR
jgi:precorrin-2 dehydrogenase/sirohydrochlorin ferrochelatase